MILVKPALLSVLLVSAVGCSSASQEEPETNDSAFTGARDLRCDEDAAILTIDPNVTNTTDLDRGEVKMRGAQFIVSNPEVVKYLSGKVDHIQNGKGQVAVRGLIPANDPFDHFEDFSVGTPNVRPEGNKLRISDQVVAVVHRVRGESERLRIVFNRTTQRTTCSTYFEQNQCAYDEQRHARGELTVQRKDEPIADWVFRCVDH